MSRKQLVNQHITIKVYRKSRNLDPPYPLHQYPKCSEISQNLVGHFEWRHPVLKRETEWLIETWWRHQMETFSALLVLCVGNSPVNGEFPAQRPVTRSFDIFFDPHPNTRLSKQSWGWWFETPSRSSWRHCNAYKRGRNHVLLPTDGLAPRGARSSASIVMTKWYFLFNFFVRISLKFVSKDPTVNKSALFQAVISRRTSGRS